MNNKSNKPDAQNQQDAVKTEADKIVDKLETRLQAIQDSVNKSMQPAQTSSEPPQKPAIDLGEELGPVPPEPTETEWEANNAEHRGMFMSDQEFSLFANNLKFLETIHIGAYAFPEANDGNKIASAELYYYKDSAMFQGHYYIRHEDMVYQLRDIGEIMVMVAILKKVHEYTEYNERAAELRGDRVK